MPEPAFHARRIPFLHSPPDFSPTTRTERSLGGKNPKLGRDFPVPHSAMYREQDCVLPIGHPGYRPVAARAGKAIKATGKPPSKQPLSRYSPGFSVAKQRVSGLAVHKVQPWGLVGQRNCVHPFPVSRFPCKFRDSATPARVSDWFRAEDPDFILPGIASKLSLSGKPASGKGSTCSPSPCSPQACCKAMNSFRNCLCLSSWFCFSFVLASVIYDSA